MVKVSGKSLMKGFYIRSAPSGGYSFSARPGKYPATAQQKKIKGFAAECGIKKGISKTELQAGMQCMKEKFNK